MELPPYPEYLGSMADNALDTLLQMKVDHICRYLCSLGFTIPEGATILFEEDVTPLEIDITSWNPVVVRKELFDPQFEHWILFEKVA